MGIIIKDEFLMQKDWEVRVEYEKVDGINCRRYVITGCMRITRGI